MWYLADNTGRILASTDQEQFAEGMTEFTFPDDFDFAIQDEYRIQNGELIHDPLPPSEEEVATQTEFQRQSQLQVAAELFVQTQSATLTDAQARTVPLLFKKWTVGETYYHKEIVRYDDGELYRIGQPEITASDVYKPGDPGTTALYSHITIDEEGYEEWKPWDGVSGIYQQDQVVRDPDDGNLYISKIPNNVWGPPHSTPAYWDPYTE